MLINRQKFLSVNPFSEGDMNLMQNVKVGMMCGNTSIMFRRTQSLTKPFSKICKLIVGIDAGQLHPFAMGKYKQTGFYSRWDLDTEAKRFI